MRRTFFSLISVVLVFALAACGSGAKDKDVSKGSAEEKQDGKPENSGKGTNSNSKKTEQESLEKNSTDKKGDHAEKEDAEKTEGDRSGQATDDEGVASEDDEETDASRSEEDVKGDGEGEEAGAKDARKETVARDSEGGSDKSPDKKHQEPKAIHPLFKLNKETLQLASQGILNGIDIPLATEQAEIEKRWGEPDERGVYEVDYIAYNAQNVVFHIYQSTVSSITLLADVRLDEVTRILGSPGSEGTSMKDGTWSVVYNSGEYEIYFSWETKNADSCRVLFKHQ